MSSRDDRTDYVERSRSAFLGVLDQVMLAARWWRVLSVLSLGIALCAVAGVVHVGSQSKIEQVAIILDSNYLPIGLVTESQRLEKYDERIINAFLKWFVERLREVRLDRSYQEKAMLELRYFIGEGTVAFRKVVEMLDNEQVNPFERAKRELVEVEVESVLKEGDNTYHVIWKEIISRRGKGGGVSNRRFRGVITFSFLDAVPPELVLVNPFGLVVQTYDISEEGV